MFYQCPQRLSLKRVWRVGIANTIISYSLDVTEDCQFFIKISFVSCMMFALCSALSISKLYQRPRYLKRLSISTVGTCSLTRNNFGLNCTDLVTVFLIPKVLHLPTRIVIPDQLHHLVNTFNKI